MRFIPKNPAHKNKYKRYLVLIPLALALSAAARAAAIPLSARADEAAAIFAQKYSALVRTLPLGRYPMVTGSAGTAWKTTNAAGWTSGFFPGTLWLLYERTGDAFFRNAAAARQAAVEGQKWNAGTHDTGFMIMRSFGEGWRLTGNERYRRVILTAAATLKKRYAALPQSVKSWDDGAGRHTVIIDSLMNLELLFFAAKNGGGQDYRDIAERHALTVLRDFVRSDGSGYHTVTYDPATGKILGKVTAQGYSNDSSWARGQAWGIYGFTEAYKETGNRAFLEGARKMADYFLRNLPPDGIPYWDFKVAGRKGEPRDSSAAAIASSALLELSRIEPSAQKKVRYRSGAEKMLSALLSDTYLSRDLTAPGALKHGTYNRRVGDFDTATIWGDYYLLEAIKRLKTPI